MFYRVSISRTLQRKVRQRTEYSYFSERCLSCACVSYAELTQTRVGNPVEMNPLNRHLQMKGTPNCAENRPSRFGHRIRNEATVSDMDALCTKDKDCTTIARF